MATDDDQDEEEDEVHEEDGRLQQAGDQQGPAAVLGAVKVAKRLQAAVARLEGATAKGVDEAGGRQITFTITFITIFITPTITLITLITLINLLLLLLLQIGHHAVDVQPTPGRPEVERPVEVGGVEDVGHLEEVQLASEGGFDAQQITSKKTTRKRGGAGDKE